MRLQVIYMEALESPRLFRRKALNSIQGKGSFDCLVATLVLVPTKAKEERNCKRGTVGARGAGGIEIILALLGGLRVWDEWLKSGGTTPCRTLSSSKGLPRYT